MCSARAALCVQQAASLRLHWLVDCSWCLTCRHLPVCLHCLPALPGCAAWLRCTVLHSTAPAALPDSLPARVPACAPRWAPAQLPALLPACACLHRHVQHRRRTRQLLLIEPCRVQLLVPWTPLPHCYEQAKPEVRVCVARRVQGAEAAAAAATAAAAAAAVAEPAASVSWTEAPASTLGRLHMQQQARESQGLLMPWMALQLLQQAVLLHSC